LMWLARGVLGPTDIRAESVERAVLGGTRQCGDESAAGASRVGLGHSTPRDAEALVPVAPGERSPAGDAA